jgi:hypothetical protein
VGLDEDTSELSFSPLPTCVAFGATRAADKWVMGLRRVYRAETLGVVLDPQVDRRPRHVLNTRA